MNLRIWKACALFMPMLLASPVHAAEEWWPILINVYSPSCTNGDPACWKDKRNQQINLESVEYFPLMSSQVEKQHHICVSFPHLKDSYWVGVAYGIIQEGRRLGQKITLVEAGGYTKLERQLSQVDDCIANGADALIIGAVSALGNAKQVDLLREKNIPVIDVVNGINTRVDAKSLQSFYNMGYISCGWVVDQVSDLKHTVNIGWFPGPPGSGWSVSADEGCQDAIAGTNVNISVTRWGDTGKSVQFQLVEDVVASSSNAERFELDYIVGTATTIEASVGILRETNLENAVDLVSFYYTPGIHDFIKQGKVAMAPSDQMIIQGRIAVDQAVRLLEGLQMATGGRPEFGETGRITEHAQPPPIIVTPQTIEGFDTSTTLAPRGWRPQFSVN